MCIIVIVRIHLQPKIDVFTSTKMTCKKTLIFWEKRLINGDVIGISADDIFYYHFLWRRERDSNPRTGLSRYTISNRAPSTSSAISPYRGWLLRVYNWTALIIIPAFSSTSRVIFKNHEKDLYPPQFLQNLPPARGGPMALSTDRNAPDCQRYLDQVTHNRRVRHHYTTQALQSVHISLPDFRYNIANQWSHDMHRSISSYKRSFIWIKNHVAAWKARPRASSSMCLLR